MACETAHDEICGIVERYGGMLLHLAMTRLPAAADAEDCVQEVFLKLLVRGPSFRSREHEKAWLIRATLNEACDMRRRAAGRSLPLEDDTVAVPAPSPSLLSAVRALPNKYSAVIHLHYYEGFTIGEIARLLGAPAATIGTRLARGRALLEKMLKEDET